MIAMWTNASLVVVALGASAVLAAQAVDRRPAGPARTVVIAELFTSEGCSSCPPADTLLRRIIAASPVPGVEVIGMGSHVDYWDRLGWRDPFSSALFSARQSAYASAVFGSDQIYTPQLVVDGAFQTVGSDEAGVRAAIQKAAARPKATVTVAAARDAAGHAAVDVRIDAAAAADRHGDADIVLAVTEDALITKVTRGENGGRNLEHAAVVRSLTTVGRLKADQPLADAHASLTLDPHWSAAHLHVVGFVQERGSRRILGAGTSPVREGSH
ncbi:MAG: DUF1223 domain-containing protein [Vicinamibacterales bacterium]